MEVVRTVQIVTGNRISLELPAGFSGEEVEIIVLVKDAVRPKRKSLKGALSKYARSELISQESGIWEKIVEEKYGN